MQLKYEKQSTWPKLSWLALCYPAEGFVRVRHGDGVEVSEHGFFEAVWAGEYADADFDLTDIVCGSGGRIREEKIVFVPSGHTLDRLLYIDMGEFFAISNSLPCILETLDASIDNTYPRFYEDFYAASCGLNGYQGQLATSIGELNFLYFNNLSWSRIEWQEIEKPKCNPTFESFDIYEEYMHAQMAKLAANAIAPGRRIAYRMISTTSSGYDSSMITSLASQHGCRETIMFDRTHTGAEDNGKKLAQKLGLTIHTVPATEWQTLPLAEIPFLAANAMGEEVRFRPATQLLENRLLLTGYHGDRVWGKKSRPQESGLRRGDPSGSALAEYRLDAGFLHCVVPFWGARDLNDILKISCSDDMLPWSVGGDYDRPICRRVVEQLGVERESFGMLKRNASQIRHNDEAVLTEQSMTDYTHWLSENFFEFLRAGRLPPLTTMRLDAIAFRCRDKLERLLRRLPLLWRLADRLTGPRYSRRFLFPWAMEKARLMYRQEKRKPQE